MQLLCSVQPSRVSPCPTCRVIRQTRTTAYKYYPQGTLEWEVVEPNIDANGNLLPLSQPQPDGVQTLFTHYLRERDGQINTVTRDFDWTATAKQRTATVYRDGVDRVFTSRIVNKLGQMVHVAMEPGYGVLAAKQDENGQYSRWAYDTFGRLKRAEPANEEPSSLSYLTFPATGTDPQKKSLELHLKGDGGAEYVTQFDLVGQALHQKNYDRNDGLGVVVDSTYDASNRLLTRTRPRFESVTATVVDRFTYDPANAAQNLQLDPSVTADQLGLASTGASAQSNGVANELAALPGSTSLLALGNQTAEGMFGSIAASVGQQLSDAQTASTADQTALTTAQANQQQQSGVSLDQEAVNVTTFERAYQANAQVVAVLNQLTADSVNLISGGATAA